MKRLGLRGMVSALVVVAAIMVCLGGLTPAAAGGYGKKSSGGTSSNLKMKYNGTYGQTGRIEMKKKMGYGSESNSKSYSPNQSPTFGQSQRPIKIEQRREMNQLIQETDEQKDETK
jgi:hypothetical protein